MIDCSAPYIYDSTLLANHQAKGLSPMTPNYMSDQNGCPTLDNPPIALEERLSRFSDALNKLFKTCKGKTNLLPHQQRAL